MRRDYIRTRQKWVRLVTCWSSQVWRLQRGDEDRVSMVWPNEPADDSCQIQTLAWHNLRATHKQQKRNEIKETSKTRHHTAEMYVYCKTFIWSWYDLDLWLPTLKTFSTMPTHRTNICFVEISLLSTDITSRKTGITENRQTTQKYAVFHN